MLQAIAWTALIVVVGWKAIDWFVGEVLLGEDRHD